MRIRPIPGWVYTGSLPAFYDTESGTAIEQTARLHGYIKSLMEDYNKFANELNTYINEFVNSVNQDQEEFKAHIDKIVHDYIAMLDEKIKLQDKILNDAIAYMKDNLSDSVTSIVNEMKESGELAEIVGESLDALSTELADVRTIAETNQGNIETLSAEVNTNKSDISALKNKANVIESDVSQLKNKSVSLRYYADSKSCNLLVDGQEIVLNEEGE